MSLLWPDQMEPNKRKIVEAALQEFADKGYELASTNHIVKRAGVSKGMLFHFFSNKKTLFLYVVDACIEYFFAYLDARLPSLSDDMLQRFIEIHMAKMTLFFEEPSAYHMAVTTFVDRPGECKDEIKQRESDFFQRYTPLFLSGVDVSRFQHGVSPEKVLHFLLTSVEALTRQHVREHYDKQDKGLHALQMFHEEMSEWIGMIKHGVYKQLT
ncbi:TetR/AcrR family transcriptional regulator [Brevibacillus humidisoli]|uniref:TetR/AcrR family transcriptional regulator n=1 Tax=Brevibacillus humidisoli TaxID=2895522 RepID=UPI001E44CE8D|nr:TetR/AcrR family transcriptional regulator [Brevibacillus humidisoli]UFJ39642.1 TetR/AcrR family transcriptional regulator [Brevibacillus humidisoli]